MTWWSEGRDVYFVLTSIGLPLEEVAKKDPLWSCGIKGFKLQNKDVQAHSDEMEEQLWAMRVNLA